MGEAKRTRRRAGALKHSLRTLLRAARERGVQPQGAGAAHLNVATRGNVAAVVNTGEPDTDQGATSTQYAPIHQVRVSRSTDGR
jgi:hypothetical protein